MCGPEAVGGVQARVRLEQASLERNGPKALALLRGAAKQLCLKRDQYLAQLGMFRDPSVAAYSVAECNARRGKS
jgi:hypothetical protein